jgi:hypothetical protein
MANVTDTDHSNKFVMFLKVCGLITNSRASDGTDGGTLTTEVFTKSLRSMGLAATLCLMAQFTSGSSKMTKFVAREP